MNLEIFHFFKESTNDLELFYLYEHIFEIELQKSITKFVFQR